MTKFDDIKIPENIKEETKKTIEKGRRIRNKNKFKYIKVASIVIFSTIVGLGTLNHSIAGGIPLFNDLFESMGIGDKNNYTKYSQWVNLTKTVNDVTLTIDEVVCDGHKLYFTYTIKSKNKLPRQKEEGFYKNHLGLDMKVDVKSGTATESVSTTRVYIDDYTYIGMKSYNLTFKGEKAPKIIKLDFLVDNIYTYEPDSEVVDEKIEGPFKFKFKISPNVDVKVIDVNETKDGFKVDSLEISPHTVTINVQFPKEFILNSKDPYIDLEYMYASGFCGKSYESNINSNEYKIKNGIVYDSIVIDNNYGIGNYDITEYIIIKFLDLKNKSDDNITEFKVYINN